MGNTEIVASRKPANKDIAIRNYNPGNVEEWSNYSQIPDSKLYYILRTMFKLKEFQNNQKAIIKCSLANNDVFVCMPTGGGKSLTFQLPLIYKPGVTVCVMPLISLIYDQEILSKRLGLHAYTATGNTSQDEFR
jgi:ATP-dependent DNA helicase Q1